MNWQLAVKERVVEECQRMNERVRATGAHPIEELEFRTRGQRRRLKKLGRWLNGYERPEELKEEWPMMGSLIERGLLVAGVSTFENFESTGEGIHDSVVFWPMRRRREPKVPIPSWWLKWMPAVVSGMEERKELRGFTDMGTLLSKVYSREVLEKAILSESSVLSVFMRSGK